MAAGHDERIDARSLKDQGIDREPTNEWLRFAKEMGELSHENTKVKGQLLDLSHDLAAALKERELFKTKTD